MKGINITGTIMMAIALVFLAVGFIMFPIVMTGTDAVLAYQYSSNATITDTTFTGLTQVIGVFPLLVLLGYVTAGVVTGFMGYKMQQSGVNSSLSPQSLIMLGLSMVFIAVGIIIFPVVLDGLASVLHNGGLGISASYTGLSQVVKIVPVMVLMGFTVASVITGFFGVESLNN